MANYIEYFDHYLLKCGVREDPAVTLSRFRNGLQPYIKREPFMREVNTLEHAYQIAWDEEKFSRFSKLATFRPADPKTMGPKPNLTPTIKGPALSGTTLMRPSQPSPITPPMKPLQGHLTP